MAGALMGATSGDPTLNLLSDYISAGGVLTAPSQSTGSEGIGSTQVVTITYMITRSFALDQVVYTYCGGL